uniref:Carbonic anhydrase 6 n=1 Tax=Sinocyclocheilus anshuiensis TaxID=1608454 RepID=A0A671PI37_9TELE
MITKGFPDRYTLHVVHYNSDKYSSFHEAKDKQDGLAVLAMNITNLNVRSMLPENLSHFFRYQGSLTTPPCHESILWTVFNTPITLSHTQVPPKVLMKNTLMDHENKTLWNDYRMAQPLNDRVVESSFLPRLGKGG